MDVIRIRALNPLTEKYDPKDVIGVTPTIRDMKEDDIYLFPYDYKEACYVARSSLCKEGIDVSVTVTAYQDKKYMRIQKLK